jgi:hypothetical protein
VRTKPRVGALATYLSGCLESETNIASVSGGLLLGLAEKTLLVEENSRLLLERSFLHTQRAHSGKRSIDLVSKSSIKSDLKKHFVNARLRIYIHVCERKDKLPL